MSTCKQCGGEIAFYTEAGRVIPRRISCTCGDPSISGDECRPTHCPKCYAGVFFLRSNGGSVWLDEVGPPWPVHDCFKKESATNPLIGFLTSEHLKNLRLATVTHAVHKRDNGCTAYTGHRYVKMDRITVTIPIEGYYPLGMNFPFCVILSRAEGSVYRLNGARSSYILGWKTCRHCGTPYPGSEIDRHEADHAK